MAASDETVELGGTTGDGRSKENISTDFNQLIKQGFGALMPTIRASNSLPKGEQWDLFCTSPKFKPIMDTLGRKTLDLMALILQQQGVNRDIRRRDLEEKYELVVEANDKILERVSTHLDELAGIKRNPVETVGGVVVSPVASASGSWNRNVSNSGRWKEVKLAKSSSSPLVLRNARITQRPQAKFLDKIDNSLAPFVPRIKDKPNALKPLAILYESLPGEEGCFSHPYEFEIEKFQAKIDTLNMDRKDLLQPKSTEETPLIFVDDEKKLIEMLEDLQKQSEFAVDLEHHSYRSFQGFTCLMQISTHEKDYLIDTLELRDKLNVLNEVFTNPKIVKVFHGAEMDIVWLQRDLCLYVVNMFDTYQAALALTLPRLSLAYLLKAMCNVEANKSFQLYDWRNRPLCKEAIKYAREDTHYLLYIYKALWNQVLDKCNNGAQVLQSILYKSADTCKKRYWKPAFTEDSYEDIYRISKKNFDNKQVYALKELFAWRDKIAREEDESLGYVLPNHMLLLMAEKLPKEIQGILACCNPIPPLVRQNMVFLHQIILKAREQPLIPQVATELSQETRARPLPQANNTNFGGVLYCPHDLTHNADFRDDFPTLIENTYLDLTLGSVLITKTSSLKIFDSFEDDGNSSDLSKKKIENQLHFVSPYERYVKMLLTYDPEATNERDQQAHEATNERDQQAHEATNDKDQQAQEATNERDQQAQELTERLLDEVTRAINAQNAKKSQPSIVKQENEAKNDAANRENLLHLEMQLENEDCSRNVRKRNRSPSQNSRECSFHGESISVTIKSESNETEDPASSYINFGYSLNDLNGRNELDDESDNRQRNKRKKNNNANINKVMTMNVGVNSKATSEGPSSCSGGLQNDLPSKSFSQFDYSQVDYNQFKQPNVHKSLMKKQDKFRQKGKRKHQNKSFTFARQYGGNKGKK